jgi:hypothetical protein
MFICVYVILQVILCDIWPKVYKVILCVILPQVCKVILCSILSQVYKVILTGRLCLNLTWSAQVRGILARLVNSVNTHHISCLRWLNNSYFSHPPTLRRGPAGRQGCTRPAPIIYIFLPIRETRYNSYFPHSLVLHCFLIV